MSKIATLLAGLALTTSVNAHAEELGWGGEGSLSAGATTGNTDTAEVGVGLKVSRTTQLWKTGLEAFIDYAETDGEETKNRTFFAGQLDRQIGDRTYAFGRASHERDQFSGFDSRTFLGGGLGHQFFDGERVSWSLEGGPGVKIDEIGETTSVDAIGLPFAVPGETVESVSFIAASNYAFDFNEAVRFTNDSDAILAEESTQLSNTAALTAKLFSSLSARFSFDVRHDTNPPAGFKSTDTATRISLVYTMGNQ